MSNQDVQVKAPRTPGPWRYEPRAECPNDHVLGVWGPNGEEIIVTDAGYYPPKIADARLIVAAPDMYAVLRDAVDAYDTRRASDKYLPPDADTVRRIENARAALAKAEGR